MRLTYFKNALLLIFLCCNLVSFAQLPDFTLTVTGTDETCSGNGSLTFVTTNTAAGASIVYTIYLLPNTTNAISTQSAATLGGLVAGTYRVIATQTLGDQSNTEQQDVTILGLIPTLDFGLNGTPGICGNGSITVTIEEGSATGYEIISGPVTVPLQTSNIFTALPPGTYQIRVFDACGEGIVQSFTLLGSAPGLAVGPILFPESVLPGCDLIATRHILSAPAGTVLSYPLTVTITVTPPSGSPVIINQTIVTGSPSAFSLNLQVPFYAGQLYSYDIQITDGCGNDYVRTNNVVNRDLTVSLTAAPVGCDKALNVSPNNFVQPFTVNFLTTPPGFTPGVYNAAHPGPFGSPAQYYNPSVSIPDGLYIVEITDACGRTAQAQLDFTNQNPVSPLNLEVKKGCDSTHGSIRIGSPNGPLVSVILVSAPTAYPDPLPHDVSFNIASNNAFYMNDFPIGTYVFNTLDSCGNALTATLMVAGHQIVSHTREVQGLCGSFNLGLYHQSNLSSQNETFWLQKFNETTGQWGHPQTGVSNNLPPNIFNSRVLSNNTVNPSLPFSGLFRILKSFEIHEDGENFPLICVETIDEFEFNGFPDIETVYSFSCGEGVSDVVVISVGTAPIIYRITMKNGQPFSVPDQSSNVFTGLEPAIYNFQVEDGCGNILNRLFDVTKPIELAISAVGICDGQPGSLTVPALEFLEYSWYKSTDPTNILSTTNSLSFAPFDAATDIGLYHVQLTYPNSNSCINQTLAYEIVFDPVPPQAGPDILNSFCGQQGVMNLEAMLPEPHDANGTWTELTSSGALTGSLWDSTGVQPGTYQFRYRVEGMCGIFDESLMTIILLPVPETPVAFLEQVPCESQSLQLLSTTISDVTYHWSGPNGFESSEQNPLIENLSAANNGTYSVYVSNEFCVSAVATIAVSVQPTVNFTIEQACIDNVYTLTAVPSSDTTDQIDFFYEWTGPGNFSAQGNPVVITGQPSGTYSMTATFANDCPSSASVDVLATQCNIPKGVSPDGNGQNDTFNLAGFQIDVLKIFNRYGMKVYEKESYVNEWTGQDDNGRELPSATYYYLVQLESGEVKTGWVYLLRKS